MNSVTNLLLTIAGVFMLVFVFYDVYATILRATKHPGPFSELLNRGLWMGGDTLDAESQPSPQASHSFGARTAFDAVINRIFYFYPADRICAYLSASNDDGI